jgi:uncharacterized membrane protein
MTNSAHLWAVGYDDVTRAEHSREVVVALAGTQKYIRLLDIAILLRSADGSLTFNGKPFSASHHVLGNGTLGLLAGFALAVPMLSDEAVSRLVDAVAPDVSSSVGIDQSFKQEIAAMIRPGTSALLVLDITENPSAVLGPLQGLGGTILKTNVDIERANLIQSTLARKLNP